MEAEEMRKEDGKVTIIGLIIIVLVVYGSFCAVKLVSANYMEKQIEKEVIDSFGLARGADFDPERAMDLICDILDQKGVIYDDEEEEEMNVYIQKGQINYSFRYQYEVNLIFYTSKRNIKVQHVMQNF